MRWFLILLTMGAVFPARAGWDLGSRTEVATLPGGAKFVERDVRDDGRTVRVRGVFFSDRQARIAVIDNAAGGSLGDAMAAAHALAGTNGAYFHPDNAPLGLMIAGGKTVHALERAKLLSGILVVTNGRPRIVRTGRFTASRGDTDALQAGPFLAEAGRAITGLNATRAAPRTIIATDGAGRWALLSMTAATLADAAAVLTAPSAWPDFRVERALNLDGGSSTGFWVAAGARPFYRPEFSVVRNFVAILPR